MYLVHRLTRLIQKAQNNQNRKFQVMNFDPSYPVFFNIFTLIRSELNIIDLQITLVFGASGISGWTITRTRLSYSTPPFFSRVIALNNRPVAKEAFLLPGPNEQ